MDFEKLVARKKGTWKADSKEANEFKKWIKENHERIEKEHGLPIGSLMTVSGHESKFDPLAKSWSGATGAFQLITDTARGYGLRVDSEVDERLDYKKATLAAAKYLKDNLKRYDGNFAHAVAQWNGGNRVAREYSQGIDPREIVSPNGTKGEIYGFLKGIRDTGEKYGFGDLVSGISASFDSGEEALKKKLDVTFVKAPEEQTLENAPTLPLDTNAYLRVPTSNQVFEAKRRKALAENSNRPIQVRPKTFSPQAPEQTPLSDNKFLIAENQDEDAGLMSEIMKYAPDLFRIYKSGGSIIQLSGDGKTVEAVLKGKERIYSRGDTKRLVELAKKAKTPNDFFLLGKFILDATKKQDSRPAEYVDA